jgi:hypothetical protein
VVIRRPWLAIAALAVVAGCASVLDLRTPSLSWCEQPGNEHAFCEDFDHRDPLGAWSVQPAPPPGAGRAVLASNDSPPNLLDTSVQALAAGATNLTGLEQAFQSQPFNHVVAGLDVRVVSAETDDAGDTTGIIGFLLIEDTSTMASQPNNLCLGLVITDTTLATVTVGLLIVPNPTDCFMVDNLMVAPGDSGAGDAPVIPVPMPLGNILKNEWQHIVLDVRRDPSGDGSGTVQPTLPGAGALTATAIPPGALAPGYPQIGIASSVTGPSGNVEIQFDNVTVDFPAN